jgi:hypothetical protein
MSLNPVTGINTINNLLKPFKTKIPIDAPGIKYLTKMIITRELDLYFKNLRNEDVLMSFEQIDSMVEEDLNYICYRRGIEIEEKTREAKLKDLKLWMSISNLRNVPHSLLLYTRIIDYAEDLF